MAKNSIDAYNAEGKTNLLTFDPDKLTIITDPTHWMYDERALIDPTPEMVLNVKTLGVIQPINVVKDRETGLTLVAAGRQRVKAAREANKQLIAAGLPPILVPGVVRQGSTSDMAGVMVAENEARKGDTPLNRANKMARMKAQGRDEDYLALMFCCSKATVLATLSLLDATEVVRNAVEDGSVTITQAQKLANLAPDVQREKLKGIVAATDGKTGHAKAQAARQVLDNGPRMRGKKEITAALKDAHGEAYRTLEWVLGMSDKAPQPLVQP